MSKGHVFTLVICEQLLPGVYYTRPQVGEAVASLDYKGELVGLADTTQSGVGVRFAHSTVNPGGIGDQCHAACNPGAEGRLDGVNGHGGVLNHIVKIGDDRGLIAVCTGNVCHRIEVRCIRVCTVALITVSGQGKAPRRCRL
jgi:hypothetical protein